MTPNNPYFIDYLGSLETEPVPETEKDISRAYAMVLEKAGLKQKRKHTKRWGRALLIAAAVTVGAAVTAAASGINVGELFRGYFEHGGPSIDSSAPSSALTQSQVKVLNRSGSALNISAANNGTTIAVKAVTGDPNNAYILFEITAPKGTKLDRNDYTFERDDNNSQMELTEKGGGKIRSDHSWGGGWDYKTLKDPNPVGNKINLVMSIHYSGIDLRGKEVHLDLKDITVPDPKRKTEYLPVLKGEWKLTVPLDFTSSTKELTVNKPTNFKPYINPKEPAEEKEKEPNVSYRCIVKSVSISPLSAIVAFSHDEAETKEHANPTPFILTLHFKDGTKADMQGIGPGSAKGTESTRNYLFDTPIEIDNVSSLTLGDLTIPVS